MRLLRRRSARQLESADVDPAALELWGERGYLRRNDLRATPGAGTLTIAEVPELTCALARGRRLDLRDVAVAAGLAALAGVVVNVGGFLGVASVPLLAAARMFLRMPGIRRTARVDTLPLDRGNLASYERRAWRDEAKHAATCVLGLFAVATAAALPVAALGKAAAASGVGLILQRRLRPKA